MSSKDKDKKKEKEEKRKSDKKDKKDKVDKKKDKDDKKKDKEDEEEQDVFAADFDKNLFPFQRMKHFSAPNQLEAKVRMKSGTGGGTLKERYAVMHCNFIIYYEVTKAGVPLESSRPIGAHKLEDMKADEVKKYDKEIISGGLIPKMRYYDFAFSVPIGDKIYVIDLPSEDDLKSWLKNLPKQIKNCIEFRPKVATLNPISLVEDLAGRFPMANNIPHGPIKDDEERWIELMRSFSSARNEHFKNLRRAQLYAEYYNPGNRAYIDWFVTAGGEAGKASLEKDILDAEDKYVVGWKKEGTSGFEEVQKLVQDADSEELARAAHAAVSQKIRYINLYKTYQKDLYNRETELFPTELGQLNSMLTAAQSKIDKYEKQKVADADKRRKEAEAEHKRKIEEARRLEEERRNDPFSDLNKDQGDPFADLKVETI